MHLATVGRGSRQVSEHFVEMAVFNEEALHLTTRLREVPLQVVDR